MSFRIIQNIYYKNLINKMHSVNGSNNYFFLANSFQQKSISSPAMKNEHKSNLEGAKESKCINTS